MNYIFPENITLDEVKQIVANNPEFSLIEKDGYTVANYNVAFQETFPEVIDRETAIRRELRGLIFVNGKVINRRFHKFFNLNEKEETKFENIDWTMPHVIMEKLDGSMVSPMFVNNKLIWGSKAGDTFVSEQVQDWFNEIDTKRVRAYHAIAQDFSPYWTLIFEWVSNKNRIVVSYPESNLILTAIRDNNSGQYVEPSELMAIGKSYEIPVAKTWQGDISKELEKTVNSETDEGIVIRFDNGHMIKVKSSWYLQLHKTKSFFEQEKDVARLFLSNTVDDLMAILSEDDQKRIDSYISTLMKKIYESASNIFKTLNSLPRDLTKKEYALGFMSNNKFVDNYAFRKLPAQKIIVDNWFEDEIIKAMIDFLLTNTASNVKWQAAKKLLGIEVKW